MSQHLRWAALAAVVVLVVGVFFLIGGEPSNAFALANVAVPAATAELSQLLGQHYEKIKAAHDKTDNAVGGLNARVMEIEQKLARPGGETRGNLATNTFGALVAAHSEFKNIAELASRRGKYTLQVKAMITSLPNSGGALVAPDLRMGDAIMLPRRRLIVRDLIAPGQTDSNLVQFPRQTLRDLNPSVVSEGAKKPESNIEFEIMDAPVRTIAHWTKAARQVLADAKQLQSLLDGELRYGVAIEEEAQMLLGSGAGQDLEGIVPLATAYETDRDQAGDTMFDTLAHALAQAEVALLPATGIVLNNNDLEAMKIIKDEDGRYIGGGPFGPPITQIWGRLVVGTPILPGGRFLVGAFRDGAQVFDREEVNVLVATENEDDFIRNKATVLCEERLAFIVKRPQAFIEGAFPQISG